MIVFPRVRGARRLSFELPLMGLGVWAWYLYLLSLEGPARHWLLSMFLSPLGLFGIICIAAYETGVSYLRDHLPPAESLGARLRLCIPGRAIGSYKKIHGSDPLVKVIRGFGVAAFVAVAIGALVSNWKLIFPGS